MSFEELVNKISPKLKAIARRLNGRFTFFDADDLYQEALIHLWEKFKEGTVLDKTDSYILQGCFFFLKNYIRVAAKRIDEQSVSLHNFIDAENEAPSEGLLLVEDKNRQFSFLVVDVLIDDILQCLSLRERDVFLLSLEELTTREVGRELDLSHVMVVKIEKGIREKCAHLKEEFFNEKRLPR